MPTPRRRRYGLEDKERGMVALIIAGGNASKASEHLQLQGLDVPRRTLQDWKSENAQRYSELQAELAPKLEQKIAAEAEELIVALADKERLLLQALSPEAVADMPAKEIAGALRNISTSKALQVDKVQGPIRGRPKYVEHVTNVDDVLHQLARRMNFSIESTAEEIPEAQQLPSQT